MQKYYLMFILLLVILMPVTNSKELTVNYSLYEDSLEVVLPKSWVHQSFDLGKIRTEQFQTRDHKIIISFCLEDSKGKNFQQYLKYRYDAAKIDVWKEIPQKIAFKINFKYDYKSYTDVKAGKDKPQYLKFIICMDGKIKYLTVTLITQKEALDQQFDYLQEIFSSINIK